MTLDSRVAAGQDVQEVSKSNLGTWTGANRWYYWLFFITVQVSK